MPKKRTNEEFIKEVKKLVGDEYTPLEEYKNNTTKIDIKHNKCGNIFKMDAKHFLRGHRCPYCAGKMKKTTEQFKKEVYNLVGDEYTVLGEYKNNAIKILMKHNKCGYEFEMKPNNFLSNGNRCPKCYGSIKKTQKVFEEQVLNELGPDYKVLSEYVNDSEKIYMKHLVCGYEYLVRPNDLFNKHTKCPKCSGSMKLTTKEFKKRVYDLVGNEYEVLGEYKNQNSEILMKHNKCGQEFNIKPSYFMDGTRCPKCTKFMTSASEKEIYEFIQSIFHGEVELHKRINRQEIDIYIPDKKLAIEFDGLYWHSDLFKKKNYHLDKTLYFKENGIRVIHIFEDEWLQNKDLIKDKLENLLGLTNNKIYARECYIKEINQNDKKEFLNSNHLQGNDMSIIRLGLYTSSKYYEEEVLVAVMTFCKPRISLGHNSSDSEYDYELSRYCTLLGNSVVGGFSKLLKYFEKNYEWNKIITYADRRWSEGNTYLVNGFNYERKTKPNYWYIKNKKRYHRYGFRKSEIKKKFPKIYDNNKTEIEMMRELGYLRIYDCGNLVFSYTRKENINE